jgi:hypothetical protein
MLSKAGITPLRTNQATAGWRMFNSFVAFVEFSVLLAVALIFVIASVAFAKNILWRAFSSGIVQIGSFPDLKEPTKDRGPYLLARTQELFQPVTLDALYEVKIPPLTTRFGAREDLKFLDDLKINIQGVDLPKTLSSLFAALPDNQSIVSATPEPTATGSAVRLEWKKPSGDRKSWLLASKLPPTDPNATTQIIDQAIYTLVFYMHFNREGPGTSSNGVQFPSTQALEAYYAGQQHLSAYQRQRERPINTVDLDDAEQQFRALYREMPQFVDGLMLLGVTLLEKQNQLEALIIFKRCEDILLQKTTEGKTLDTYDKKVLFQARLLHATALRKLYDWRSNHEALKELKEIESEMLPLLASTGASKTSAQFDYLKIYISTLTEEAYTIAVNLVLLNEATFIEALTEEQNPVFWLSSDKDELEHIEADLKKATADQLQVAKQKRAVVFRKEMEKIYKAHRDAVEEAFTRIDHIERNREVVIRIDQIETNKAEDEQVRERLRSDLYNAEAYAGYRRAQAIEEDDTKFLKVCEKARSKLHEAYALHQNEYTILLNLGLVYGDPRCDPENKYAEFAREFLKQSIELKPRDYYGHELLARLTIRQAHTWGLEFMKPGVLDEAVNAANTARELRPGDGSIFALLAQAYILQWANASDDNSRKKVLPLIEASLEQAAKCKATPVHLATAWAQWLLYQSRLAQDDQFKGLKPQLAAALDKAIEVAKEDRSWYGRQLIKDATKLKETVSNLEDKKQATLRWPS